LCLSWVELFGRARSGEVIVGRSGLADFHMPILYTITIQDTL
jgi:hypothetical protein